MVAPRSRSVVQCYRGTIGCVIIEGCLASRKLACTAGVLPDCFAGRFVITARVARFDQRVARDMMLLSRIAPSRKDHPC